MTLGMRMQMTSRISENVDDNRNENVDDIKNK